MKKFLLINLLLAAIFSFNYAQTENGVIYGKVLDASTKEPLIGVNIILLDTNFGAATDENGKYRIENLPNNTYRVKASLIGYGSKIKTDISVSSSRPIEVDFELSEEAVELESVTVTDGYFNKDDTELISTKYFGYEEIRRAPGGFEDVVRALSVLPGVAQADPGRNDLIVRGGAPSENLYVVDGIRVQNINHFGTQGATGGPLSYINLDFVKNTSFSTGGFSTIYGDKLSSVLKINLREGRKDRIGGKATVSATQFGLDLEGPFSENSSFVVSARRSYLDFIFKAAGFGFVPEYYDAMAKADFNFENNNSLSFLFISAFDNVRFFNDTQEQRFDNSRVLGSDQTQYVAGLTYQHLFNNGFFKIILSRNFVDYDTSQRDSLLNPIFLNTSREQVNSLRGDVVYKFSPKFELNAGTEFEYIKFESDILFPTFATTFGDTLPITSLTTKDYYYKSAAYLNFNSYLFNKLTTNIGLRLDYFNPLNKQFYFAPRFSASYKLNELTNLNFSTGIYYQSPSYIWLAAEESNKNLESIRADHYIVGIEHNLREDALLKVEGFIKDYKNYPTSLIRPYLVLANTGAGYSGSDNNFNSFGLEPLVSEGNGLAKGVELSVQKKLSDLPFYGIMSLTYSQTNFTALDGIERTGSYDQTWIFNLSGGYKFNEEWEASLKFRYATGKPYTPYNPDGTQNVSEYNTARVAPNHSLDLRVDRRWFFENFTLITYLDVQNVYNRQNRSFVRWDPRTQSIDNSSSIGILPTIGVSLEF